MELAKLVRSCAPKVLDWKGQPYGSVEVKLDGYSAVLSRERDGSCAGVGRKAWNTDLWRAIALFHPAIAAPVKELPPGTVVMGELWVPGHPATAVPTALNGGLPLNFTAFALPMVSGVNRMFNPLDEARAQLAGFGFTAPARLDVPPRRCQGDAAEVLMSRATLRVLALEKRVEGFVLKHDHFTRWYRYKPVLTTDVFVVGWQEHRKKDGVVGSFEVAAYRRGQVVPMGNVGSGFKLQERLALQPQECMNRVMEVEYEKVGARGGLIFPRFLRWRDDKLPTECGAPEWEDLGGGVAEDPAPPA